MALPEVRVRPARKQLLKFQVVLLQKLVDRLAVERILVQDADLAAEIPDVRDHLPGLRLVDGKLVLIHAVLLHELDKRLDREGVVLHRDFV